ncbi:MAG TPA: hypothetical protein VGR57_11845 [Ktedonobacterales bacterium]|nr:hypothetical protein [Ktedonobacterales bacterium]
MISQWRLRYRWWHAERKAERWNWRVMTAEFQGFELYHENGARWELDVVQD